MRIALVIAGPYPAHRGSQVLVSHLALGLRGRGHDVRVVSYGTRRGARPGPRFRRLLLDGGLVARLWRVARRARIDVLHAHNYEAAIASLLVGRATGLPVVYHGHSAHADELPLYVSSPFARRWMARLGRLLDAQVPRRADFCIAVSDALGAQLRRGGVAADTLACLDPALAPNELEPVAHGAGEEGRVCYAGNLDPYQRLDFLLDSFALVHAAEPGARLRLVSHPDARGHAAHLAARGLGPGVEIILAQSYAQVRDEVGRAAVVVSPRAERSGFPMKLLTYLALGKAIVACAGSAKGLVDGVTARVVADGDPGAFAAAIAGLLRDPGARERLGRAARRCVEDRAGWDAGLDRIEGIYRRVLAAGAGRLPSPPVPVAATE
jgi:glycosyltransferase involved in cell wall biosynthesis